LSVAAIGPEFREQPQSTDVNLGVDAGLECKAPKGQPEPRVRWRKDGEPVKLGDRLVLLDSGSLRIRGAQREDAGQYVCVAFNTAGEKDSQPARLAVRGELYYIYSCLFHTHMRHALKFTTVDKEQDAWRAWRL